MHPALIHQQGGSLPASDPVLRGHDGFLDDAGTSISLDATNISGLANGDLLVAIITYGGQQAMSAEPGSGWTKLTDKSGNANNTTECWWAERGAGGATDTPTWTFTASEDRLVGVIMAFQANTWDSIAAQNNGVDFGFGWLFGSFGTATDNTPTGGLHNNAANDTVVAYAAMTTNITDLTTRPTSSAFTGFDYNGQDHTTTFNGIIGVTGRKETGANAADQDWAKSGGTSYGTFCSVYITPFPGT